MLCDGIIEESSSPWSSPDSSIRLYNDFRRLNAVSDFHSYPLPRVDDLVEHLGRAWFISTLDLTKWQVPPTPDVWAKTTFSTTSDHWQCWVLPMELQQPFNA